MYEVIDQGEELMSHISLTDDSDYPNVRFQFGEVKFDEVNDDLHVAFTYQVFHNPKGLDTDSQEFQNYIGDILWELIEKQVEMETQLEYLEQK